ncbi:TPA: hypothetical protein DEP21_02020 [Patescibacteria group bacterium]|nr:hypothetical protein [Candidatus Gracilibacteria bacterium]
MPSIKLREDENFIALLDIFPNTKGQAIVFPKKHYESNIANLDNDIISNLMIASNKVINLLRKGLNVDRVGIIIEGMQVNHIHVRLYPFFGSIGFENGIDAGPKADVLELQKLADEILHSTNR